MGSVDCAVVWAFVLICSDRFSWFQNGPAMVLKHLKPVKTKTHTHTHRDLLRLGDFISTKSYREFCCL